MIIANLEIDMQQGGRIVLAITSDFLNSLLDEQYKSY
jgi:hypothetical protein